MAEGLNAPGALETAFCSVIRVLPSTAWCVLRKVGERRVACLATLRNTPRQVPLVVGAEGAHPVPSRTRQLSPPAPMVLGAQAPGRVGHRQRSLFCCLGMV
jgi:hypothetical protein